MVSVCLPSDALLQHLLSYLGFSYLGVSFHGCTSKVQPMLLTLDEGYLLTAALPDLQRGIAPLGPPVPHSHSLGLVLPATAPGLGRGVAPPGGRPWPQAWGRGVAPSTPTLDSGLREWGISSRPLPLANHWPDSIQRKMAQKQIPHLSTLPPAGLGVE